MVVFGVLFGIIVIAGWAFLATRTKEKPNGTAKLGIQQIWGKSEIVIGLDDAFPPIGFRDSAGTLVGFDVDLATEAFGRMGLKPVFRPVVWDSVILSLTKKDIDVIWNGLTITETRKNQIAFSDPYLSGEDIFIVRDDGTVSTKEDMKGKVIGVQSGSQQDEELRGNAFRSWFSGIKSYDTIQAAFLDMKAGRVDAVLVDNFAGLYTANQVFKNDMKTKAVSAGLEETFCAVGLRKEDTALASELNRVLGDMRKDGTISRMAIKWFNTDAYIIR